MEFGKWELRKEASGRVSTNNTLPPSTRSKTCSMGMLSIDIEEEPKDDCCPGVLKADWSEPDSSNGESIGRARRFCRTALRSLDKSCNSLSKEWSGL